MIHLAKPAHQQAGHLHLLHFAASLLQKNQDRLAFPLASIFATTTRYPTGILRFQLPCSAINIAFLYSAETCSRYKSACPARLHAHLIILQEVYSRCNFFLCQIPIQYISLVAIRITEMHSWLWGIIQFISWEYHRQDYHARYL